MSRLKNIFKYFTSFQLLDSPNDYEEYLNFSKHQSSTDAILNDFQRVNDDFKTVLNKSL